MRSHGVRPPFGSGRGGRPERLLIPAVLGGLFIAVSATTSAAATKGIGEPALDWAVSGGGLGYDTGLAVGVDATGHSVVTGYFHGQASFGSGERKVTLASTAPDAGAAFIARYHADGTLDWAKSPPGPGYGSGAEVAVAADGTITVLGHEFDARFSHGPSHSTSLSRYSPQGDLHWQITVGGIGGGVAVDRKGNAIVAGSFYGQTSLGAGEDQVTLTSAGNRDAFLARYTSDGTLDWAVSAGGTGSDPAVDVAVDAGGNPLVTGFFGGDSGLGVEENATFGAGADRVVLTSTGNRDVFVARYTREGKLDWATSAGGAGHSEVVGHGIAVGSDGSAVVTGDLTHQATFGEGRRRVTMTSVRHTDVFVARYKRNGALDWVVTAAGSDGPDHGRDVAVDARGRVIVTGEYFGRVAFGQGDRQVTLASDSSRFGDAFVARYTKRGELDWAVSSKARSNTSASGLGVGVDRAGNALVTGNFDREVTFGSQSRQVTLIGSPSGSDDKDFFLVRFDVSRALR